MPLTISRFARPSVLRSILHGTIATSAYIAAQWADMRITGNRYDDRVFWGGYLVRNTAKQRLLGTIVLYTVGTVVAAVYRAVLPVLPRWPGWILGAAFVGTENTLRFPTVAVMSACHPSVRRGELPSLWNRHYFWVEEDRHLAFGLVLGLLTRRS